MMSAECAGCLRPILDRYILHFLDKTWHSSCVKCQFCKRLLDEKCFYKEGKIYCRDDFYRCFGPKCAGCGNGISPQDYVRKARDKVYHLECFTCSMCSKQLSTGEVLYLQPGDDALLCKDDYMKTHNHHQHADGSLFSEDEDETDDTLSMSSSLTLPPPSSAAGPPAGLLPINPHSGHPHDLNPAHAMPPMPPLHNHPMPQTPTGPLPAGGKLETNNNSLIHGAGADPGSNNSGGGNGGNPTDLMMMKPDNDMDSLDGDADAKGDDCENKSPDGDGAGGKRRGPRTTIKAKQLEVLKTAFSQTPKPTRHIREQLAKETGLTMRVIQVWFQNKRSKERRMKQMTNGMMAGRGFFPGKGGRRGFPLIGDEFGYFPHDKPYHDFGYPPNFPPPEGFFPGPGGPPMGFMGPPPPGGNMDPHQPLPMHGGAPPSMGGPPPGMGSGSTDGMPSGDLTPEAGNNSSSNGGSNSAPGGGGNKQSPSSDSDYVSQPGSGPTESPPSGGGAGSGGGGFSSSETPLPTSDSSSSGDQNAVW